MKILLIGFLVFSGWSVLSTYTYVCKIRGLCDEPVTRERVIAEPDELNIGDTLQNASAQMGAKLPENQMIYFAFDRSEFNPDANTDQYFDASNAYLEENARARLSITGYTDAVGSDEYNQALGYRRAQRMQQYFEQMGMPANKITIESKGEYEPADNNTTAKGRANNRRTEITIKK